LRKPTAITTAVTTDKLLLPTMMGSKSSERLNRDKWCLAFPLSHRRNSDETVRIHPDRWSDYSDELDENVKPTQLRPMAVPGKPGKQVRAGANALFPGVQGPPVCQAGPANTCAGQDIMLLDHKIRKGKG
jgi:hypothetical protein